MGNLRSNMTEEEWEQMEEAFIEEKEQTWKDEIMSEQRKENLLMKNKLTFTPSFDKVLIKPIVEDKIGKIHIPANVRDKPLKGTVVSFGREIEHDIMPIDQGDTVYFVSGSGKPIKLEGEEYLIMKHRDLIGKD